MNDRRVSTEKLKVAKSCVAILDRTIPKELLDAALPERWTLEFQRNTECGDSVFLEFDGRRAAVLSNTYMVLEFKPLLGDQATPARNQALADLFEQVGVSANRFLKNRELEALRVPQDALEALDAMRSATEEGPAGP